MNTLKNIDIPNQECDFCKELSEMGKDSKSPTLSRRGAIMLGASAAVFAGITSVLVPFVFPGLRRISLPFIPASSHQINNVMKALRGRTGKLIDIGSGDGRITLAAARNGFQAYGVELNIWLVLWSRWTAWRSGLHKQAKFFRKDLWKTDLSIYQNVVIFGVESMMKPLEDKLDQEMLPGTHIVACRFPLPSWQPVLVCGEGIDSVWLYVVPQQYLNIDTRS
ncbi:ATP synthase subunit C lysine N-methyltransferase-like isoform X1 [Biomphalaria glabrata]|uniref:ATP synthase subunit C lysine N-methyltransferase-like isoform X1 n=1 Tax=Biomphalaria glabrata TaxID=6526 RepID=A0A9W3B273_BIOGL|nr:ATP synthase subunit C lysine N-methyltransferase-like isoform X1 [Biomphalaria glabrata]XP_013074320.2 ATP synthase subunit C lysine N-methyltransferase-like isoform X1 [Biomphalaria glabrata]XP_055893568.1 ATP synthase subunit C lysine N-methyltransferase-like isoform X1 [Biomphalaria glabrata]XP_055893569.1 ATP synthase subunit C lysine N-methyltransferase-like isoform X1 [Biomphalaria glabrata]XP_055893570.1 ATP synthase subunit C lysine N-methyltransferase-like isoform X1 [Biomphalaria 